MAAMVAGNMALLTAGMLVWFALYNVAFAARPTGSLLEDPVLENVVGGIIGAGSLFIAAAFTFARRIAGVWTLYALCMLDVLGILVVQPLLGSTTFVAQLKWLFGFHESDGAAMGLTLVFSVLTAITAAIAGTVESSGPSIAKPPRP